MSKKKRLKKIVKSRLNRIKPDGDPEFVTTQNKIDALASMGLLADGTGHDPAHGDGLLLDVLGIANPGAHNETLSTDLDAAVEPNDAFPLTAVEQKDTDGDNIGDNRDIIETKARLDAIFRDFDYADGTTPASRAVGTLQVLMDEAQAIQELVNAQYDTVDANHDGVVDGGAVAIADAKTAIQTLRTDGATDHNIGGGAPLVSVAKEKFTAAGLDQLVADIDAQVAQVAALKAEIAAMTATAGVTVKSPAVANYTASGASVGAKDAAAATAATLTAAATAAKLRVTKAITGDESSGSKLMLAGIDGA